jgi:hypothetical protein
MRIKMGIRITIGLTKTINVTITTINGTITSGPTLLGQRGRQTHGRAHKLFFAHTTG